MSVIEVYEQNKNGYVILLVLSVIFLAFSVFTFSGGNLVISVTTLIVSIIGLIRKERLYIPPAFIAILVVFMILLQLTRTFEDDSWIIYVAASFFLGMFTCLLGLMLILAVLKSSSGLNIERPFFISFIAFCISITLSLFLMFAEYGLSQIDKFDGNITLDELVANVNVAVIGAGFIGILFYLNRHNGLFRHTLGKFLSRNADNLGVQEREREKTLEAIEGGESSKLEFKSTLRTNLKTGEKDPRMERAVLKTIVAFLNSKGGTLLIGVADDGTILGVDLQSFEGSKDKFGLHLNHLITTQIGSEFLPFMNYGFVEFDDKPIMKVTCIRSDRPVFLTDGKEQIFYVRSGPSSIDLHGTDLLYYANHNFGKSLKKKV